MQYKKDEAVAFVDSFFVRLTKGKQIYFTETEKDTVVIGNLIVDRVWDSAMITLPLCFKVENDQEESFTMCAEE